MQQLYSPQTEEETLVQIDEHMRFIEDVLNWWTLPEDSLATLRKLIDRINIRRLDPNLYLAVIGNFSSGKSTFINALLRNNLLKTGDVATTAIATYIAYAPELAVTITFSDDASRWVFREADEPITLPQYGLHDLSLRDLIYCATADDDENCGLVEQVARVDIGYPSEILRSGIVIIDTPGADATRHNGNATALAVKHNETARQVVRDEADAAIILISSTRPASVDLTTFLRNFLSDYLHRCVFVITRADQVRVRKNGLPKDAQNRDAELLKRLVDETTRLAKSTYRRLTEESALPTFYLEQVHLSAAQAIIDELLEDEENGVRLHGDYWRDAFVALEQSLIQRLQRERLYSISENVLRLLHALFSELKQRLTMQWDQFRDMQEAIDQRTIEDITVVSERNLAKAARVLKKAQLDTTERVTKTVKTQRAKTIEKLRSKLDKVTDTQSLNTFNKDTLPKTANGMGNTLNRLITQDMQKFQQGYEAACDAFDTGFNQVYVELKALQRQQVEHSRIDHALAAISLDPVLASAASINKTFDDQESNGAWAGAATGAVLGSTVFPVIGTIVGGFVGFVAGAFWRSVDIDKRKTDIWQGTQSKLVEYFDTVEAQVRQEVLRHYTQLESQLEAHAQAHVDQYRHIVEGIRQAQREHKAQLQEKQVRLERDSDQINSRERSIEAMLKSLKTQR